MNEFIDYLKKNKYVFICVSIVVLLYAFGIIQFITKFLIFGALIIFAIFIGKTIQDNEKVVKSVFKKVRKEDIYYYQEKNKKK